MKLGTTELLIILAVVILIFGPTQIPKLTKMFGKSVKSFKDGMGDDEESQKVAEDAEDKK
jgi:sec-independent protein translocase protein TatA